MWQCSGSKGTGVPAVRVAHGLPACVELPFRLAKPFGGGARPAELGPLSELPVRELSIDQPHWLDEVVAWDRPLRDDDEAMALAIALSRENVLRDTGGPFGALILERDTGRIVAAGVNSVVRLGNSLLHGETVAFMLAQKRLGSFTLAAPDMPVHQLVSSCEPCAMCLGATLWSGVRRVVYGALREDASRLAFDEGPVFPASYRYLEERGIEFVRGVRRAEAREVLELYRRTSGTIYNA